MLLTHRLPSFVFSLFEGEGEGGGGEGVAATAGNGAAGTSAAGTESGSGGVATQTQVRNTQGRFESTADYERRIAELKDENVSRRRENKELKTSQEALASQINTANQRVIRSEARDALRDANVISPRIVDIFLSDLGDKVKIDPKTGEPVGIAENLEAWKAANPDFFKAPATTTTTETAAGTNGAAAGTNGVAAGESAARGNSTAAGASLAGGAAGGDGSVNGLPNLRDLPQSERKAAIRAYKESVRTTGRR